MIGVKFKHVTINTLFYKEILIWGGPPLYFRIISVAELVRNKDLSCLITPSITFKSTQHKARNGVPVWRTLNRAYLTSLWFPYQHDNNLHTEDYLNKIKLNTQDKIS